MLVQMIAIPFLFFGFMALMTVVQFRRAKGLTGPHTYEFNDSEIHLQGPAFDTHVKWEMLTRCYGGRFGLLFMSGGIPIISVPLRALPPEGKGSLQELLREKNVVLSGSWER